MSDSIVLQYRGVVIEDLLAVPSNGQVTATVLGLGPVLVTPFVAAPDDPTASAAGVLVGQVYICNAAVPNYLRTRMT